MPTFNDGTPVVDGVIVTLEQALLYNPQLANMTTAQAQAAIDAATSYVLTNSGYTIADITPPYNSAIQQAVSLLSGFIGGTIYQFGFGGILNSESLGDYSYSSANGIRLSSMVIPQMIYMLLFPWIKRNAPAKVHQHTHRHHRYHRGY